MTREREEAINYLKNSMAIGEDDGSRYHNETLEFVIKELKQEPCEDCVSRQQALKELKESAEHHANDSREEALLRRDRDIIRALPPVTPTRKKGKWIEERDDYGNITGWHCSNCYDKTGFATICARSYCPACGAEMESEEDD